LRGARFSSYRSATAETDTSEGDDPRIRTVTKGFTKDTPITKDSSLGPSSVLNNIDIMAKMMSLLSEHPRVPLPLPRSVGTPFFKGKNVSRFLMY
jgi:hypothetical protein